MNDYATASLGRLLAEAGNEELGLLVDYVTDAGEGRLALGADALGALVRAKHQSEYQPATRELLANEILAFGGNTIGNALRGLRNSVSRGSILDEVLPAIGDRVSYEEVVRDVASHLKVDVPADATVVDRETAILMKILRKSFAGMSEDERRQVIAEIGAGEAIWAPGAVAAAILAGRLGGFATYKLATIVANSVARALLGRGLSFAATGTAMRTLSIAIGPIGWVLTGLWTIADFSAPAYRVTVPCVIQIAYIRQRLLYEASTAPGDRDNQTEASK
jgi:uncharacterized protein YaaW (UPF0174 family)